MISGDSDLSAIGALLSEPARALILLALSDGRALPASMLASEARVSPSTASEHLRRLVAGGLLTVSVHGRYRYFPPRGLPDRPRRQRRLRPDDRRPPGGRRA